MGQIKNIKLVSGLSTDLVSVGQLLDENDNINILLSKNAAYIVPNQLPPAHKKIASRQQDRLYTMDEKILAPKAYLFGRDRRPVNDLSHMGIIRIRQYYVVLKVASLQESNHPRNSRLSFQNWENAERAWKPS